MRPTRDVAAAPVSSGGVASQLVTRSPAPGERDGQGPRGTGRHGFVGWPVGSRPRRGAAGSGGGNALPARRKPQALRTNHRPPQADEGSSRIRRLAYPRWPPWWPWSAPGGDLAPLTASLPAAAPVPRTSPRLFSSPRPCSRTGCSSCSILPEIPGRASLPAARAPVPLEWRSSVRCGTPPSAAGLLWVRPSRRRDGRPRRHRGTTRPRRDVSAAEERVSADHLALASPTLP